VLISASFTNKDKAVYQVIVLHPEVSMVFGKSENVLV